MGEVVYLPSPIKSMVENGGGTLVRLSRVMTDDQLKFVLAACRTPKERRTMICRVMGAELRQRKAKPTKPTAIAEGER